MNSEAEGRHFCRLKANKLRVWGSRPLVEWISWVVTNWIYPDPDPVGINAVCQLGPGPLGFGPQGPQGSVVLGPGPRTELVLGPVPGPTGPRKTQAGSTNPAPGALMGTQMRQILPRTKKYILWVNPNVRVSPRCQGFTHCEGFTKKAGCNPNVNSSPKCQGLSHMGPNRACFSDDFRPYRSVVRSVPSYSALCPPSWT